MTSRSRLVPGGLLVALVLAVAACSSGAATPAPAAATPSAAAPRTAIPPVVASALAGGGQAGTLDANTFLSAEVAASIIGGSPTRLPVPGSPAGTGMSLASYTNANGDNITALVEPVPQGLGPTMLQTAIQAAGSKGELQPLSGLGDAAGQVSGAHDATVAFAKGDTLVVVYASAAGASGSDLEPKVEALARQIAAKL